MRFLAAHQRSDILIHFRMAVQQMKVESAKNADIAYKIGCYGNFPLSYRQMHAVFIKPLNSFTNSDNLVNVHPVVPENSCHLKFKKKTSAKHIARQARPGKFLDHLRDVAMTTAFGGESAKLSYTPLLVHPRFTANRRRHC